VVEVADGRRWAQQRQFARPDKRPQNQHVVALIRVPRPAGCEIYEAKDRGQQQKAGEHEPVKDRLGC
jgi:hypothetical protein